MRSLSPTRPASELAVELIYSPKAIILSALASEMPLTVHKIFFGVNAIDSSVQYPASNSFSQSFADIP